MNQIAPDNVYALVVGIERYAAGPDYNLNGPASDALKFSRWLLNKGVDPEHIYLFLAPLDANIRDEAEDLALISRPPSSDQLAKTIRSKLLGKNCKGDLLYIFWSGHGIVTPDATTRRLFVRDTDIEDHKVNLNLNSLINDLKTASYKSGFLNQIMLIDACANQFYQDHFEISQAENQELTFGASGGSEINQQFILFAASEYEVATNQADSGTGLFFQAVIEELENRPLFPDSQGMKEISHAVQQKLREQQKTVPVYWSQEIEGNKEAITLSQAESEDESSEPSSSYQNTQVAIKGVNFKGNTEVDAINQEITGDGSSQQEGITDSMFEGSTKIGPINQSIKTVE